MAFSSRKPEVTEKEEERTNKSTRRKRRSMYIERFRYDAERQINRAAVKND
jgi:hypothetical protein